MKKRKINTYLEYSISYKTLTLTLTLLSSKTLIFTETQSHPKLVKEMALTLARALSSATLRHPTTLSKRVLSTITHPPPIPTTLFLSRRPPLAPLSSAAIPSTAATRFTSIRCRVNRSGNSAYSPLNSGSNFSDRPPTEMAPLFPGCDYEHWLIVMDKPGGEGATKQQMIDCYIQTLAKIVGRYCSCECC